MRKVGDFPPCIFLDFPPSTLETLDFPPLRVDAPRFRGSRYNGYDPFLYKARMMGYGSVASYNTDYLSKERVLDSVLCHSAL